MGLVVQMQDKATKDIFISTVQAEVQGLYDEKPQCVELFVLAGSRMGSTRTSYMHQEVCHAGQIGVE